MGVTLARRLTHLLTLIPIIPSYAPHFKGPITPQESVELQMKVIEAATVETMGGAFVSHFGNKQWL